MEGINVTGPVVKPTPQDAQTCKEPVARHSNMKKTNTVYTAWSYAANKRAANKDRVRIVRTTMKALPSTKARLRTYQALPATKERIRTRNKTRASRVNAIENEYVTEFLRTHPDVQPKSHLITDAQIEGMPSAAPPCPRTTTGLL